MPADKTHITGVATANPAAPERTGGFRKGINAMVDTLATMVLWAYFTVGFILFFAPFYGWIRLTRRDVAADYQRLNSRFYIGFFWLLLLQNILINRFILQNIYLMYIWVLTQKIIYAIFYKCIIVIIIP